MKKVVSIIGGGPAAMLLAAHLNTNLFDVTIYEKNKALGRKFLVAGKGGFNLTHSENLPEFIARYTPTDFLKEAITSFSNNDLRTWLNGLNLPTFVGSSKRIYPKEGIKPIEVLNAILDLIHQKDIQIKTQQNWLGWNNQEELIFESGLALTSDITIFSVGGGSWKKTGSAGEWTTYFENKNIETVPFEASNCAFKIDWNSDFLAKNEGKPLKNIEIHCKKHSKKGETIFTTFGIEGGAIYALSPQIREQLQQKNKATITIDLKPSLNLEEIIDKLHPGKITQQLSNTIKLEQPKIDLLKSYLTKEEFIDLKILAQFIKNFPLEISGVSPVDEAISTVGGIALSEVDQNFELLKMPNNFTIGEMLNYDAPTGGYLLQSCFSMGVFLANHLNQKYE
jgi:uncharacterized flavoprotein (TIGR03862 family)